MAKTKSGKIQRRKNFWGYLFIAPNFIGFIAFMLVRVFLDRSRSAQWDRDLRAFLDANAL